MSVALSGCLKEELPVPRAPRGDAVSVQVCIGADYGAQLWYDIGTNSVTAQNSKQDWDLAFAGGADGWVVRLNSARYMRVVRTGNTDLAQSTDTTGYGPLWRVDHNEGSLDSLAIGDWRSTNEVFVVDLGVNNFGTPLGLRRMKIVSVDASRFTIRFALIDGSGEQEFSIQKDPSRAFVHFSILDGVQRTIAPPDGQYDLVFTQYTYQFYDPYTAYLVTGAVNGFSGLRVAELNTSDFNSIALRDTMEHPFNREEDAVGYDWKEYDFDTSTYEVHPEHCYIVQDREGGFYKLHFVDFYSETGLRGCPRFEVVPL
ncbi:MAG: HmuY family protein [Flavobacteriales bacterium]